MPPLTKRQKELALLVTQLDKEDATFAPRVKRIREHLGLTQAELAEALGKSEDTVRAYEHGRARPTLEGLFDLAGALEVATCDLIWGGP